VRAPQTSSEAGERQRVAEAVRDAMRAGDRVLGLLGTEVLAVGPGCATVALTVRADMLNGHDICHGGLMTTLADTAFAYACNAYNEVTVATGFDVNIVASGKLGDRLTATATEAARTRRTGVYDVEVRDQTGRLLLFFRGRSMTRVGMVIVPALPCTRGA